ncbi:MAG TPA: hypothetical protein VMX17_09060 [Candidatus Glassbacteria bacterium]|nr:hypothetical protein [Candidatus Glassbacteria bacterium]
MNNTPEEISAQHRKYDVAIDFDGVIHSYKSGWLGFDVLVDPPVDGAIKFLKTVLEHFRVSIMSTRAAEPEGIEAIKNYLKKYGMTDEEVDKINVTSIKIHAKIYIDDRGYQFNGTFPTVEYLRSFLPWYKR